MGLDMFAYTTTADIPAVDFDDPGDAAEFFYWRKHPNLHGWMEALYRAKGGSDQEFDLNTVRLEPADLNALEAAVKADKLPFTTGFFFGESRPKTSRTTLPSSKRHAPPSTAA